MRKPDFFVDLFPKPEQSLTLFELAKKEPAIVVRGPVRIQGVRGDYISKMPLTTLLCHGRSTADGHVTQNGLVDTALLYRLTSQYLGEHNLPPIDLFFSCDEHGLGRTHPRWDQKTDNPVLGVANSNIYWGHESIFTHELTLRYPAGITKDNPFTNRNHPKRYLVYEKFKMVLA